MISLLATVYVKTKAAHQRRTEAACANATPTNCAHCGNALQPKAV